jgi:hypothetical protein
VAGAGRRFLDPGGRPGPGLPGLGALAGRAAFARMFRNLGQRFDAGAQCCHEPPAVSRAQLGSAEHFTDHGNSAAAPQVRVRHAWQQGGDPLIGSNGAVRGMPAGAAAGRRAHCNLWSARA